MQTLKRKTNPHKCFHYLVKLNHLWEANTSLPLSRQMEMGLNSPGEICCITGLRPMVFNSHFLSQSHQDISSQNKQENGFKLSFLPGLKHNVSRVKRDKEEREQKVLAGTDPWLCSRKIRGLSRLSVAPKPSVPPRSPVLKPHNKFILSEFIQLLS